MECNTYARGHCLHLLPAAYAAALIPFSTFCWCWPLSPAKLPGSGPKIAWRHCPRYVSHLELRISLSVLVWHTAFATVQVAYLLLYGNLPSAKELARFEEAVARHSAVPASVEQAIKALPHDAHFMGSILVGINALSTCHPEQNPALAGQDVYKSKEIQDKQIVRLIGTV